MGQSLEFLDLSGRRRPVACFVACIVLMAALPAPATAYPGSVNSFEDGASGKWVNVYHPPRAQFAGTVLVGSNATVVSGSLELEGTALDLDLNFTHDYLDGFPNGTFTGGVVRSPPGLTLGLVNGSTEFSGGGLDFGAYSGTTRIAEGVVLTGRAGSYNTPDISWNGVSYGRIIANVTEPVGSFVSFSVLRPGGSSLQSGLRPGDLITVDGAIEPVIQLRAYLEAPTVDLSPRLTRLGAGYVLADYGGPTSALRTLTGLRALANGTEIGQSYKAFVEYASNPILDHPTGTWYLNGPETGSAIAVGTEIWMYVFGDDSSGKTAIGRLISANGGTTWTADSSPIFAPTASTWDSQLVRDPFVMYDEGVFKMWYSGASISEQYSIGYATSGDGVNWTNYAGNPVFSPAASGWDSYQVGWPTVVKVAGTYYLYYTGRVSTDARHSIGMATSTDGISWSRYSGNPLWTWGSTSAGAYEISTNDVQYADGVFYLYWTCAATSSDYDACVSTSTDGTTFVHDSSNPIITNGDGSWDSVVAAAILRVTNPITGRDVAFFTGFDSSFRRSVGRADPRRESPGTYEALWDLSGEIPHAFTFHDVVASTPPQTSIAASLGVGDTSTTIGPPESVRLQDDTVVTAPAPWLRHFLNLSTADAATTPQLRSSRISYDRYRPAGAFESASIQAPYPISNATLVVTGNVPPGTQLGLSMTNDGGRTWMAATPGKRTDFPTAGTDFRYHLDFAGTSARSPTAVRVEGKLGVDSRPNDVKVQSADGSLLATVAGKLAARVTVPLDPAYFNSRIAAFSMSVPPIPVPFELWVNASTAGSVHIAALRLDVTYPDALRVYFAPEAALLLVEEGEVQGFRAVASTTPGVAIQYAWWVDGVPASSADGNFSFIAGPGTLGNHTVFASVTNGQFTSNKTWNLRVVDKPVYLVAKFYPGVTEVEVPVGLLQQFYAAVANSTYPATISWVLDGQPAAAVPLFEYHAPNVPGRHVLRVEVTNGFDLLSWTWNITVTDVPGAISHQLVVTFTPEGDIELSINETEAMGGAISGPAPPDISWEWTLDGSPAGSNHSRFELRGTVELLGDHRVSLLVHNATAVAAHGWTVSVVLPPAPAVFIVSPTEGTQVTTNRVQVHGTASRNATVSVGDAVATVAADGSFSVDVALLPGANRIVAYASDSFGRVSTASVNVTYTPPGGSPRVATEDTGWLWIVLVLLAGACVLLAFMYLRARRSDGAA